MVSDSGGENADDDGPRPLESGREDNRQQLSLVADLGERNHDSGCEQGFHEHLSRGQAAQESNGHRVRRPTRAKMRCHWSRSEEHTSELQSLMRISYAVFCLKKKNSNYTLVVREASTNTDTLQT